MSFMDIYISNCPTPIVQDVTVLFPGVGITACWECGGDGDWTKFHPEPHLFPNGLKCVSCKGTGKRYISAWEPKPVNDFWKTDTYKIVQWMKARGNQSGLVALWKADVEHWARYAGGADAEAVKLWLPIWQVRPYYTAAELAPIFPVLAVALGLRERPAAQKSPARLANELRMAQLPHFQRDGEVYFVVEQCHRAEEFANAHDG